jgi:two-component system, chemotaxis family, chemotaxis protein CheY
MISMEQWRMKPVTRILLIDDDEAIREFVSMALGDEGYEIITAANGAAALDLIERHPPSLILLDMRMPILDGWSFAEFYRQRPGPHAPIIMLTAAQDAADCAAQIDADGFLAKPFDLSALLDLVDRYTRRMRTDSQ